PRPTLVEVQSHLLVPLLPRPKICCAGLPPGERSPTIRGCLGTPPPAPPRSGEGRKRKVPRANVDSEGRSARGTFLEGPASDSRPAEPRRTRPCRSARGTYFRRQTAQVGRPSRGRVPVPLGSRHLPPRSFSPSPLRGGGWGVG